MSQSNQTAKATSKAFQMLFVLAMALCVLNVCAQTKCRYYEGLRDNKDGTVTDPRSKLIWKRCAEGFTLDNDLCVGREILLTHSDALEAAKSSRFLDKTDWRLPSKLEFAAVMGKFLECRLHNNHAEKGEYALSPLLAHPVRANGLPGVFWTSTPSPYSAMPDFWNYASVFLGLIDFSPGMNEHNVRLVRAN